MGTTNGTELTKVKPWYGSIAHAVAEPRFSLIARTPTLTATCGTKVLRATLVGADEARPCEKCFA